MGCKCEPLQAGLWQFVVSEQGLHIGLVGPIPPPNGGMAMQTRQLGALLRSEGVKVTQVATNRAYRPRLIAHIPIIRAFFRLVPYLFAVWRLCGRVDVVHLMANSGWSWQLYASPVLWVAAIRGTPVIVNYRGGEASSYFQRSFGRVRAALSKAALIVVPSGYLQAVFAQYAQDSEVIPNIVDLELFKPTANRTPGAGFTLVITRNLEAIYGIDVGIIAVASVLKSHPGVRLRIAGSGPEESKLRSLVNELGIEAAVSFEGRLEREAVADLYASCDAMLNPTTVDNMPNSVLEALASGLPVISTNVGGVPHIVEDGRSALLVPPAKPDMLAAAIIRLLDDDALQSRLRANGLAEVQQYAWKEVRDKWLDAYHRLRSGRSEALV
jgi:glycosyltransferase involved in cell wall biosynthesis